MIPKVIHYCWFSGDKYPSPIEKCLDSWLKILPDYELKRWDASNIDFDVPFSQKAFREKKWAFLTDYIRMKVLFEEGGIFLDTDILMVKPFDDLLTYSSFWNFADNGLIEPVVIGASKGNNLVKECKLLYENYTDKELENYSYIEIPKIITPIFVNKGLASYNNHNQILNDNIILTHEAFCPLPFNKADTDLYLEYITIDTYCVHLWNAAWFDDEFRFFWNNRWKKGWRLAFFKIKKNPKLPIKYYKDLLYQLSRQLKIIK